MIRQISDFFYRFSSGWMALLGLLVFALFLGFVLPGQAAQAESYTQGAESPDGSFFYSTAALYEMAEAYGEAGRAAYIRARFTFDLVWPLAYLLFFATSISWVYGRAFAPGSRWRLLNLFPLAGVLFDYLENIGAALVMARYPAPTPGVDVLTPFFTAVKWIFVNGSFGVLLVGVAVGLWKWARQALSR